VGHADGQLHVLDDENGNILDTFSLAGGEGFLDVDADPILCGGHVVAASHGATLVRTAVSGEGEDDVAFPVPLVGSRGSAPADELRRELGIRGFDYAVVVDRDEVSMVLAEMGALAYPGPRGETSARLVPSSSDDPRAALDEDMWQSWSHQSEAAKGLPPGVRRLVVPIAVIESAD
jgi:hypothetical protein